MGERVRTTARLCLSTQKVRGQKQSCSSPGHPFSPPKIQEWLVQPKVTAPLARQTPGEANTDMRGLERRESWEPPSVRS